MPLIPMATAILVTNSSWSLRQASENDYELAIGLVAYTEPSVYVGRDNNEGFLTYVEWEWQNWFFRDYSLGSDLAGGDNWYLSAAISYGYPLEFWQWSIDPQVSLTCAGSQVAHYYVGVDAAEAKLGRPAYRPGRACQYQAGVSLSRLFGESHRFLIGLNHRRFSSEIHNSPIVDRAHIWSVSAGYLYAF